MGGRIFLKLETGQWFIPLMMMMTMKKNTKKKEDEKNPVPSSQ
jgi:hypothetical protein